MIEGKIGFVTLKCGEIVSCWMCCVLSYFDLVSVKALPRIRFESRGAQGNCDGDIPNEEVLFDDEICFVPKGIQLTDACLCLQDLLVSRPANENGLF